MKQRTDLAAKQTPEGVALVARHESDSILPPVEQMEKYENLCPGAIDRILTLTEEQTRHRMNIENSRTKYTFIASIVSIFCSLLVVLTLAGVIIFAISHKADQAALGTTIAAIATVSGVYIFKRASK